MSSDERIPENSFRSRARDLAINVLVFGAAQVLLALLLWQLIFRTHPQGFALGLTLVGFGSWAVALMTSSRGRYRTPGMTGVPPPSKGKRPWKERMPRSEWTERLLNVGCGTVLFLSGLIALGLAFALRVRADMQTGMTWSDIFPTGQ